MVAVRMFRSQPVPKVQAPQTAQEWHRLMQQAIARAEMLKHRHLPGLQVSMAAGNAEQHLRSLGIISQTCIDRVFPLPK
jgi:hypothetical protein